VKKAYFYSLASDNSTGFSSISSPHPPWSPCSSSDSVFEFGFLR